MIAGQPSAERAYRLTETSGVVHDEGGLRCTPLHLCYPSVGTTPTVETATVRFTCALAGLVAAAALAGCGSTSSSSRSQTNPTQAQAQRDVVNFARCMRSHGVPNFPDDLDFRNVPGINPSSPGFETAQSACQPLLPVKSPPTAAPSARTHARLLRLSNCLRAHGFPSIPDPRPNPPPSPGSPEANRFGALYGEGDYWIGIPTSIDGHGAAFVRTARACGATGVGP
jgi:hypothetical protein